MTHIPSEPADTLVRAIVVAQSILAQHLEPQGMSADQAVALLLGVLDHEDVVRTVAEVAQALTLQPVRQKTFFKPPHSTCKE